MELVIYDKRKIQKINTLIKDIQRNPYSGIGKPEHWQVRGRAELMMNIAWFMKLMAI